MKLTKENYELIMFDLLEGNLPDKDIVSIHTQIQQDEFFSREWELFKSTLLIADEAVSYPNKEALLREEKKIIPMRNWLAISIAASIVIAFFIFIPNGKMNGPLVETPYSPRQSEINLNSPTLNSENTASTDSSQEIASKVQAINKATTPRQNNNNTESNQPTIEKTIQPQLVEHKPIEDVFEDPIEFKPLIQQLSDTTQPEVSTIAQNIAIENIIDPVVTNNPIERISSKVIYTIAKLRQPSMKLQPNWKEKNFKIELETTGYHAIASVDPFKKK